MDRTISEDAFEIANMMNEELEECPHCQGEGCEECNWEGRNMPETGNDEADIPTADSEFGNMGNQGWSGYGGF